MAKKPVVLIIRDGWGINPGGRAQAEANGDATLLANTPFHDHLYATYPWAKVSGSGEDVGLPPGQMGNSEVGHLNLGAGRIVYQDLTRINKAIREGALASNEVLVEAFEKAKGKRLHLLGAPYAAIVRARIAQALGLKPSADVALIESEIDRLLERRGLAPDFTAEAEALRQARGPHELLRRAHALRQIERKLAR